MTSNHQHTTLHRALTLSRLTILLLCSISLLSGCGSQLLLEAPLCPERDFVLQTVSVEDQNTLRSADAEAFGVLASNDLELKSHIRKLENMILAHDEPLGDCD